MPPFTSTGAKPYTYLWFNANGSKQRLARVTFDAARQTFDRATETILLEVSENENIHNGGGLHFGPDGFLYFGNRDDGTAASHQTLSNSLFAGIFRIDVDLQGAVTHAPPRQATGRYSQNNLIPNDNPFVGTAKANEELYALGIRNPFSFSFDKTSGQLWAGDVGDRFREEVNQPSPNCGCSVMPTVSDVSYEALDRSADHLFVVVQVACVEAGRIREPELPAL